MYSAILFVFLLNIVPFPWNVGKGHGFPFVWANPPPFVVRIDCLYLISSAPFRFGAWFLTLEKLLGIFTAGVLRYATLNSAAFFFDQLVTFFCIDIAPFHAFLLSFVPGCFPLVVFNVLTRSVDGSVGNSQLVDCFCFPGFSFWRDVALRVFVRHFASSFVLTGSRDL